MAREQSPVKRLLQYAKTHKKRSVFGGVVLLFIIFYGVTFFVPKSVQFSYAGDTCVGQLTLLPSLHKAAGNDKFIVSFRNKATLGSFPLVSSKTCFKAVSAPKQGEVSVATAPFGGVIARKAFVVTIPKAPVASAKSFEKSVPATKPLEVVLSAPDTLYRYRLAGNKKYVDCRPSQRRLVCDLAKLDLTQGRGYDVKLMRAFGGRKATPILDTSLKTLKAVTIKKASLDNNQIVYDKPTKFIFDVDKPLKMAKARLSVDKKDAPTIAVKTGIEGKRLTLMLEEQLARETRYKLQLNELEATDGSGLIESKTYTFTMSGGPKIQAVSVGASRVAQNAVISVQFDQPIATDVAKYLTVKGGAGIVGARGSTATIALQNLPRCQPFTIELKKGLKSVHGVVNNQAWQYRSRTICHSIGSYGVSQQGRSLMMYKFGSSGPVTLYVGAIHGNESSSSTLLQAWVEELESNPDRLKSKQIVVVPTINPDGLAAGLRTNSRGVNLNRNFPTSNWTKDIKDTDGNHKGGGGSRPLSEPEASALARLTARLQPRLIASFHAVGSLTSGDSGAISATYAATYASMVGYRDTTGQGASPFDYDVTGSYEAWTYEKLGVPSTLVELSSYSYVDANAHFPALWAGL